MSQPIENQMTFDEWALDVTCANTGALAFVPICGDEVVWGLTMIQDRAPGSLSGVVSQNGMEDVEQWVADNPNWMITYSKVEDLCNA